MKPFYLGLLFLSLAGCAGMKARQDRERRKDAMQQIVIEAVRNNESCSTICIKLKQLLAITLEGAK